MKDPLGLVEYASECYASECSATNTAKALAQTTPAAEQPRVAQTSPTMTFKTALDVEVAYVHDARIVYVRNKPTLGPMFTLMSDGDIHKFLTWAASRSAVDDAKR